jgi:hypothetical protein
MSRPASENPHRNGHSMAGLARSAFAKVISRFCCCAELQTAEVPIPRELFADFLRIIAELRSSPLAATP